MRVRRGYRPLSKGQLARPAPSSAPCGGTFPPEGGRLALWGTGVLFVCALKQALNGYPKDLRKPIELDISYSPLLIFDS